jgi:hypothetical protein
MGGWGSKKVMSFCYQSAPFTLGECTLGKDASSSHYSIHSMLTVL